MDKDDDYFLKIQNDENLLQDHIRNKYERKRWAPSKITDPMTLVYRGEDISGMNFRYIVVV